jgi:exodeoxyribonuclease V gamma subunit
MKVYRSNMPERLAQHLVELLAAGPNGHATDPIAPELVVVGSHGMERWLVQQIAQRVGVCAGVEFPFPGELVRRVFAAVLGDGTGDRDRWAPEELAWSVLRLLPGLIDRPELAPLDGYLGDGSHAGVVTRRRVQLARRIADTFDRYLTYRPEMVLEWESGGGEAGDWQPVLWRALAAHIGRPHLASLARRLGDRMAEPGIELPGIPERIFLFGLSTLPPFHVRVLRDLARHREVHLFVPSPARGYWAEMSTEREAERLERLTGRDRAELHVERLPPLLDAFGRLFRDFQGVLLDEADYEEPEGNALFDAPDRGSMLHAIQRDMLDLVRRGGPDGEPRLRIDPADGSIRVHACHSPMRQVEVLRDELLALFAGDPELEPRHVVVMTPDLATFAPLVDAVFSDGDERPGGAAGFPRIPFQIADRSLRAVNPVAEALLGVLGVAGGRLAATEVLDLVALDVVRDRFGIGIDELAQVREWVGASGIAWGLDDEHRVAHAQPRTLEATWRLGLDRLLLGVALRGHGRDLFEGVLSYDEVEGTATELLGRFVELLERLFVLVRELKEPRPLPAWKQLLLRVIEEMIDTNGDRGGLAQRVRGELDAVFDAADGVDLGAGLDLAAAISLLEGRFETSLARGGFLDGRLTICSMIPMRTIPFRVVCLLGMDDGAFPRTSERARFDKLETSRWRGDRPRRDDDRSIFLEAILAARDYLIVTYTGRSVTTNERIAPAVPVGELLDVLDASFVCGDKKSKTRDLVTHWHPLQPFSPRNFGLGEDGKCVAPTSHDRRALAGAVKLGAAWTGKPGDAETAPGPFIDRPLPDVGPAVPAMPIDLSVVDLVRFLKSPVQWFLERRLGLRLEDASGSLADREPVELGGLERHALGTDLLGWDIEDHFPADPEAVLRAGGRLPLGTPGRFSLGPITVGAATIARAVRGSPLGPTIAPRILDVLLGPVRLVGQVSGLHEHGLLVSQYGRIRADHRLAHWVRHLALTASGFEAARPSRLVGRDDVSGVEAMDLPAIDMAVARGHLEELAQLFLTGQRVPLVFFPETSNAYALAYLDALDAGQDSADATRRAVHAAGALWTRQRKNGELYGDGTSVWVRRVLGDPAPCPAEPGFTIPGLEDVATPTFHDLALAVWRPLIHLGAAGGDR